MGMLGIEPLGHGGDAIGEITETLVSELEVRWVIEVGLEFSREVLRQVGPCMALPSIRDGPSDQILVDANRDAGPGRDLLSTPKGTLEGRGPDGNDRPRAEVTADAPRLVEPMRGKPEARAGAADELRGIVDLGMSDEMYQCSHVLSLAVRVPIQG